MYRPKGALSPELTASSVASLGKVVESPHSDAATKVTASDASPQEDGATNVAPASHGSPTWTAAIRGTVPEAEIIGAAAYLLHAVCGDKEMAALATMWANNLKVCGPFVVC